MLCRTRVKFVFARSSRAGTAVAIGRDPTTQERTRTTPYTYTADVSINYTRCFVTIASTRIVVYVVTITARNARTKFSPPTARSPVPNSDRRNRSVVVADCSETDEGKKKE